MAFTKTVNYIQTIPTSLGYQDEVSGTTQPEVSVCLSYDNKLGRIPIDVQNFPNITQTIDECKESSALCFTGGEADINALLNSLEWIPATYDSANAENTMLDLDRKAQGEAEYMIETRFRYTDQPNNITVDDELTIGDKSLTVTAVEGDKVFGYTDEPFTIYEDLIYGYDYIVDYADIHAHGLSRIYVTVYDGQNVHDSGITTMIGSYFVKEIDFISEPNDKVSAIPDECTGKLNFGETTQADNELYTVQLLIKKSENDPDFTGDIPKNKPEYLTDESFGKFTTVQVGDRISENYEEGEVRWSFYGDSVQCNKALTNVRLLSKTNKDFYIETRAVNGRYRNHKHRGIQNSIKLQISRIEEHPLNSDGDGIATFTVKTRNEHGTVNYFWEVSGSDAVIDVGQGTNTISITFTETEQANNVQVHVRVFDDKGSDYWTEVFSL